MRYDLGVKTICLRIRDCPAEIHRTLAERAAAHKRSVSLEAVFVLKEALGAPRMSEEELRRAIYSIPSGASLSLAETQAAIREGRK